MAVIAVRAPAMHKAQALAATARAAMLPGGIPEAIPATATPAAAPAERDETARPAARGLATVPVRTAARAARRRAKRHRHSKRYLNGTRLCAGFRLGYTPAPASSRTAPAALHLAASTTLSFTGNRS